MTPASPHTLRKQDTRIHGAIRFGLLLILTVSFGLGCSEDTPTEPSNTIVISGSVDHQGFSENPFTMTVDGLLQVTLDDLFPQLPDGVGIDVNSLTVGLSLGRQTADGCATSGALALRVGDSASYGIDQGEYCLNVYDAGFIPTDSSFDFTLNVQMTNF